MKKAKLILDKDFRIAPIDKRLFGSFAEHLGRTIYNGIYEPGHPLSDEHGFRRDVIDAVKEAGITVVRYPGGNFVSAYDWRDGVGPISDRPRRPDPAWHRIETNHFGTDEFARWTNAANVEFMATVNLGQGDVRSAGEMLEYCNLPSGTYYSDLRQKHGHKDPYQIKLWCLGNEMDGPWQMGQLTAELYGVKAKNAAFLMKQLDPSVELVACGTCATDLPTYLDWDRTVLEHTYENVDYLSIHAYYSYQAGSKSWEWVNEDDPSDAPFISQKAEDYILSTLCVADTIRTKKKQSKKIHISFDEWNVHGMAPSVPSEKAGPWATQIKEGYSQFNLLDALIYGGLLCTFLNHADRVKIACQSLLVNDGGMFSTKTGGGLLIHPVFYPFQQFAKYGKGEALRVSLQSPTVETSHHGEVPALQAAASYREETGEIAVFVVNMDHDNAMDFTLDLRAFGSVSMSEHRILDGNDIYAYNTFEAPHTVEPRSGQLAKGENGVFTLNLTKSSFNLIRFSVK